MKLNNWILFWSSISLIFFSTFIIYLIEPETFPTPFDALWWVMTTVTTVGYGDFYPVTVKGRIFAILLYIVGIGLIGLMIGKVVDFFSEFRRKREEGRMNYKGKGHIVIIGWSPKAKFAVQEILESSSDSHIVIIDQLEKAPLLLERVHYIRGKATHTETLERANIVQANSVLLFADESIKDDELADGKTLLIASSIEQIGAHVHTTVEIMNENHIKNFQHIKVDDFLLSHEMISTLAVRSAMSKGVTKLYTQLVSRLHGEDIFQIKPMQEWRTYREAFDWLLKEGATLIADHTELNINRRLDDQLKIDSCLFIICNNDTYEKITQKIG